MTCTKFGANRSSRLTASPDIWICDPLNPPPPQISPGVLWGNLYLAYVHSQMNPQTWTRVGVNRSNRFTASLDFWMIDPLKPPSASLVSRRANCLAYIHSQMDLHMCAKFGANRSSRLIASTDFWICDLLKHPKCPHGILRGELYLAYVDSQTNPQSFTKFGANRSSRLAASPNIWICDLNPPPPPNAPGVLWGELYLAYFHSQMNLQTWTKVGANRSSRLTASPDFLIPLNPPSAPLCLQGWFVWRISIPRWICRCVQNLGPIGPAVWQLPKTFEFVTP